MKIILIGNKAQHGKDTFAQMLFEAFEAKDKKVFVIHFGDCVKYIAEKYYNWNGLKDESGRSILQYVGGTIRENDEHFWTDFVVRLLKADYFDGYYDYVLIPDWRHQEEHSRMLETFNFEDIITVNIQRYNEDGFPFINPAMLPSQLKHKSEIDLDGYPTQYIIENHSLDELRETADAFAEMMIAEG